MGRSSFSMLFYRSKYITSRPVCKNKFAAFTQAGGCGILHSLNFAYIPETESFMLNRLKAILADFFQQADLVLLGLCCTASIYGLVLIFSATNFMSEDRYRYIIVQGAAMLIGIVAYIAMSMVDLEILMKRWKWILAFNILMFLLLIPFGVSDNTGNTGWLRFFGIGIQPSEIAKVAIVLYFADSISKKKDKMHTFRYGILPYALLLMLVGGLVLLEPHLSGAILIMGAGAVIMLVGGINWAWVGGALGAAAAMMYFVLFVIGYNASRITYWLYPWEDAPGSGYQLSQSLLSIGSGGLLGVGLGKSRQKFLYLPEPENDFIFAIVCEELGFIGALVVILLFALLIWRGFTIVIKARDRFGAMLVTGFIAQVGVQAILNMAVVTNTIPSTGISLPFFSYGGTALAILLGEMGIVLSVSRQTTVEKEEHPYESSVCLRRYRRSYQSCTGGGHRAAPPGAGL